MEGTNPLNNASILIEEDGSIGKYLINNENLLDSFPKSISFLNNEKLMEKMYLTDKRLLYLYKKKQSGSKYETLREIKLGDIKSLVSNWASQPYIKTGTSIFFVLIGFIIGIASLTGGSAVGYSISAFGFLMLLGGILGLILRRKYLTLTVYAGGLTGAGNIIFRFHNSEQLGLTLDDMVKFIRNVREHVDSSKKSVN